jgi:DNA-directed RNA polymerase subunit RPC12/RpoP/uncharacterized membrane protein
MKTLDEMWLQVFWSIGIAAFAIAGLLVLVYIAQFHGTKSRTEKYRLASKVESKTLRRSANLVGVGIGFIVFTLISDAMGEVDVFTHVFVGFLSLLIALSVGYAGWAYLKYYYPFFLENRLHRIRFKPMVNPHDGHEMRLLNEEEEDTHLSQDMMDEEETLTVDYDVWMDDLTGFKVIERYDTHYHALLCDYCNFRTLKEKSEEVVKEPTLTTEGELIKHYECNYCGRRQTKHIVLPSWEDERQFEPLEKDID